MEVTREMAELWAEDFLSNRNPEGWDGRSGKQPNTLNRLCCTYDFGSPYVVLDVYLEYDSDDGEWIHVCEIVDKEPSNGTVSMCERLSGNGINSYLNIADTILDICNNYDWFNGEE